MKKWRIFFGRYALVGSIAWAAWKNDLVGAALFLAAYALWAWAELDD